MSKAVLITGGAGFIGSRLAEKLSAAGHAVTVLDNLSPQVHGSAPMESEAFLALRRKVKFIHGDVTSADDLGRALEGVQVVVHLAAETGTGQSMYEIDRYCRVNMQGTALLLDILANSKHQVSRFVIASSRSIYGEGRYRTPDGRYVFPTRRDEATLKAGDFECHMEGVSGPLELMSTDEDSKLHPSSVYGITKLTQEQLVMTVCPAINIVPYALRYQNVYGPGQSLTNPYTGILSIFSGLIRAGKGINVFEDGKESRDFVFVSDVVDATAAAATGEVPGGVYNIGSGIATSVNTVVSELLHSFGKEVPVTISGNFRLGDIRHNFADITRARKSLGFEPKVSFAAGVAEFVRWVSSQAPAASAYERSLQEMRERKLLQ